MLPLAAARRRAACSPAATALAEAQVHETRLAWEAPRAGFASAPRAGAMPSSLTGKKRQRREPAATCRLATKAGHEQAAAGDNHNGGGDHGRVRRPRASFPLAELNPSRWGEDLQPRNTCGEADYAADDSKAKPDQTPTQLLTPTPPFKFAAAGGLGQRGLLPSPPSPPKFLPLPTQNSVLIRLQLLQKRRCGVGHGSYTGPAGPVIAEMEVGGASPRPRATTSGCSFFRAGDGSPSRRIARIRDSNFTDR
jgi:hypothetical protein